MGAISRFEIDHWDEFDRPILRVIDGGKPCTGTKRNLFLGRAMKGPNGCVCPGCTDACALPAQVKAGSDFVVLVG